MDEIKPVVTEKSQFDCRHESKILALFRIFWTIRIPMQGPNSTAFQGNSLPLIGSFQLRTWWKKSGNYLWRNEVIENRAFPKLMATFPLHLSIRLLTKGRNAKIFPCNTHLKEKDFVTDLDEKNEACFFMDKKVATSMNSNTVCAFPQCENSKVLCSSRSILEQAVSFLIPERWE